MIDENKESLPLGEEPPEQEVKKETSFFEDKKELIYYIGDILFNGIIIVGLVLLIRMYVISPFKVSGQSMCDTLNFVEGQCLNNNQPGEYIIINKFNYNFRSPKRGEIVVFQPPVEEDEYYVKRVIGIPGDTVTIVDGKVRIQNADYPEGFFLDEPYLNEQNRDNTPIDNSLIDYGFEVPEGHYFMMGDNRRGSSDSRHWKDDNGKRTPFVPEENIDGKVWFVLFPLSTSRMMPDHKYQLQ